MNKLTVTGKQDFMGIEIPVVLGGFGVGKKCLSDRTIADIHYQPTPEIRRRISDNIMRFNENVDYLDLKKVMAKSHNNLLTELGYSQMQISKAEHIYILSECGYAKLIKIMDSDLAWEIHGRPNYKIRERISDNIKRFKESVDYIDLKKGIREADTLEILLSLGYAKQSITQADQGAGFSASPLPNCLIRVVRIICEWECKH